MGAAEEPNERVHVSSLGDTAADAQLALGIFIHNTPEQRRHTVLDRIGAVEVWLQLRGAFALPIHVADKPADEEERGLWSIGASRGRESMCTSQNGPAPARTGLVQATQSAAGSQRCTRFLCIDAATMQTHVQRYACAPLPGCEGFRGRELQVPPPRARTPRPRAVEAGAR